MTRTIVGYLNGRPQWSPNEPAAAAVQGHGASGLGEVMPTFHLTPQRRDKPDPHASRKRRRAEERARKALR